MNAFDDLVTRIATQARHLRGTGGTLTVPVGRYYYQMASRGTNGLLIETVANKFLPADAKLNATAEARLADLGLLPPGTGCPNWSIRLDNATDAQIDAAALAVATALTECYRLPAARTHAVLRSERDQQGNSYHLEARLMGDGSVQLAGQDFGPITAAVGGDGEYEYWRTIAAKHVPALIALIGGEPGDDVIDLLARHWSGRASFDLERRLRTARFPIELFTY